jgi:hypothetical protein
MLTAQSPAKVLLTVLLRLAPRAGTDQVVAGLTVMVAAAWLTR